ncbi:MAG: TolC family protein [Abditibacteriaceae bacterium]
MKLFYRHSPLPLVVLLCVVGVASADTATLPQKPVALSLQQSLLLAQQNNPQIQGAQATVDAAHAALQGARSLQNPTLTVSRTFGKDTGSFDEDVILSQLIGIGKRGPRTRQATRESDVAVAMQYQTLNDLQFAARSAYDEALQAQAQLDLSKKTLDVAQAFSDAAKTQFEAGDAPQAQVIRSGIALAQAKQQYQQALNDHQKKENRLKSLIGMDLLTPLQLTDTLHFAPVNYDLATLDNYALEHRPDLQAARMRVAAQQAAVGVARSLSKPDLLIEARRAALSAYPGLPNGSSIRIGCVIPIFDFGSNRAAVHQAQANARGQQAQVDEDLRVAQLEVAAALSDLESAQVAVQSFDQGRLSNAKQLLDMAQIGYSHGANSYLELLDAQSVYATEQANYEQALTSWNIALASLQHALGGKLP